MVVGEILEKTAHKEVEWNIDEFFLLTQNEWIDSPEFFFTGVEWRLQMLPGGSSGFLQLWLRRKGSSGLGLTVDYRMGLKRSDGTIHASLRFESILEGKCENWMDLKGGKMLPWSEFVKEKTMLAPRGRLTVFCYLRLVEEAGVETFSQTDPTFDGASAVEESSTPPLSIDKVLQDFRKLLLSGDGSDVTIKVKGEELKAHKLILGARTPVFASMFRHQMAESSTGLVSIDDCEANVFKEFLNYVYSGSVQNMSSEMAFGLHTLADKYQLDKLGAECSAYMQNTLSVDSFCEVVTVALRHHETDLLKLTTDFFSLNIKEIIRTVKWQVFMRENPTEANELMINALGPLEAKG